MAADRTRRTTTSRDAAEAAFKAALFLKNLAGSWMKEANNSVNRELERA